MQMVRPRLRLPQGGNGLPVDFFPGTAGKLWKTGPCTRRYSRLRLAPKERPAPATASRLPGRYNGVVPFVIRDFKPGDFEILWRMDQECFAPGISYSPQELKSYIRRRGSFTLVARDVASDVASDSDNGTVSGFIVAHEGATGHIITIDVLAGARRSGVGSMLLGAAEDRLRASGSHAVGLETAVDNLAALAFYKRHGYSVIKTWPRYYSNGVDALVMRKELSRWAGEKAVE